MLNELIAIVITSIIPYIILYFSERNRYIGVFIENRTNVRKTIPYLFIVLGIFYVILIIKNTGILTYLTDLKFIIENKPILVVLFFSLYTLIAPFAPIIFIVPTILIPSIIFIQYVKYFLYVVLVVLIVSIWCEYKRLFDFKYKYRDEQFLELIRILSKKYKKEKKNTYLRDISSLIEYMFNDIDKDLQRPYNTSGKRNIDSIIKALNTIDDLRKIDLDKRAIRSILKKAYDKKYCKQADISKIEKKLDIKIITTSTSLCP